jgi:hypothetical protein
MIVGKSSIGSITNGSAAIQASRFIPLTSGKITAIYAYGHLDVAGTCKAAVYSNVSPNPAIPIAESFPVAVGTVDAWTEFPLSHDIIAGAEVWFAILGDNIFRAAIEPDTTPLFAISTPATYPTFNNPFSVGATYNYILSIYALYDEITPPPDIQINILTPTNGTVTPSGVVTAPQGSTIQVTATPYTGYTFKNWLLDNISMSSNPLTLTFDAYHTLEAIFEQAVTPPVYNLSGDSEPIKNVPYIIQKVS